MTRPILAVLALSLILAACGDPPPPAVASGPAGGQYFPLVDGARWVYSLDLGYPVKTQVEVRARGRRAIDGLPGEPFVMDEATDAEAAGFADVAPVAYLEIEGYMGRVTGLDYDGEAIRLLGGEDPARFLPLDPEPGTEWEETTRIFEQPEGGGGRIRWLRRLVVAPALEVPAGTFRDVIKVETEYWDESEAIGSPLLRYEDYYARGVGLVRSLAFNEQRGGERVVEQLLLRHEFPAAP